MPLYPTENEKKQGRYRYHRVRKTENRKKSDARNTTFFAPVTEQARCMKSETMFFFESRIFPAHHTASHDNGNYKRETGLMSPGKEPFYFPGQVHAPDPAFQERDDEPHAAFELV